MTPIRMGIAIVGTLVAALAAQFILSLGLHFFIPWLSQTSLPASTPLALTCAYVVGSAFVAIAAGTALGKLAHDYLPALTLVVGGASLLLSFTVAGRSALPHGWQIAGYIAQLGLILFIARSIARGRAHPRAVGVQAA